MADQDLKAIFEAAHGNDPAEALKNDDQSLKAIFQTAHDTPIVPKEIADQEQNPEPSEVSALATLGAKGLTGGLTGVAAGAGAAAGTAVGGKPDWESMKAAYQEALETQKAKETAARQKAPILGTAAEIAGSVPSLAVGAGALKGLGMASKIGQAATLGGGTGLTSYLGNNASPTASGAALSTGVGTGLGALGGLGGEYIVNKLNPEALEVAGSKMASKAVGIKPSRELTQIYDPNTGKIIQGSDVIKGIGSTAIKEGALPMTGGPDAIYDKSLDAIDRNYQKLMPAFQQAQAKIDQNMPQYLEGAGNIGDKTADFLYQFRDELAENPNVNNIMDKIDKKYVPYIQQLTAADGNLSKLNTFKKALQDEATNLSAAAYDQPASDLKPEAEFVKRLGGIVRQHIEDLADAADPGAGDAISSTNKTLSDLYSYRDAAKKLMDKGSRGDILSQTLDIPSKILTGNTTTRLAKMAGAKAMLGASKAINTPAGELAQKAVVNIPLATVTNPFTQNQTQKVASTQASKLASNLYNATDDSLKEVASYLRQTPGLGFYGDNLDKAINENNEFEKGKAIFVIMQNPASRKLVTNDNQVKKNEEKALDKFNSRNQ